MVPLIASHMDIYDTKMLLFLKNYLYKKSSSLQVDQFLISLVNYDKENVHPNIINALGPYLSDKEFDPDFIMTKSGAAAGLCSWVINVVRFYEVRLFFDNIIIQIDLNNSENFQQKT